MKHRLQDNGSGIVHNISYEVIGNYQSC